ncbi:hypothetical protein KSF78_0009304 [Schistosoma japonicum]|nr:hypothetical protein KSF78_0009304 [Schistosoma japonicum]
MQIIYQYLSFASSQSSYKWKLLSFFHLIYTSSCYSSWNSITMQRRSTVPLQSLPENYINLLELITPMNNDLQFNLINTSSLDCNQWETSSYTEAQSQIDYNKQQDLPLSHTPLLPLSFLIEMIPFPRVYPGRSFFFSRLDDLNRIRLAIGLNQWGKIGECMELWIHHELFYSLEPTPNISTYYTGSGLVNHAGLVIVPLPNYRFNKNSNNNKPITLIIEITYTNVKVYQRSKSFQKLLFGINYHENMKYHNLHGDLFENKSIQSSKMDQFFILSGGPYHRDRFLGFMKQLKMFFTEFGAQKYCSDERNFKPCENELNVQNITIESQEFKSTDQSNQTGKRI